MGKRSERRRDANYEMLESAVARSIEWLEDVRFTVDFEGVIVAHCEELPQKHLESLVAALDRIVQEAEEREARKAATEGTDKCVH